MRPKFETGFSDAAERAVFLVSFVDLGAGAVGTESAGMDSTIGLPNTGGPAATGFGAGAALSIFLLTRRLKDPTCKPTLP